MDYEKKIIDDSKINFSFKELYLIFQGPLGGQALY